MKIYYGKAIYDQKEIQASLKVLKDKSLTLIDGPAVKELEGKISKFLAEVSLTEQDFVKDPNVKISKLLADNNASILSFTRYEVGEGIEVEKVDFASEVMSQIES